MNDQKPTRDPRLEGKRDGTTVNQAPFQLPAVDHKGHKADDHSITRSKNPKLRRKHAQQKINSLIHQAERHHAPKPDIPRELISQASRPQKRSK